MNGTCNYILPRMGEEGIGFEECLRAAQELGYAEADPTFDIEGYDTAHKLAILASLCFGCEIAPDEVFVEGITSITAADIKVAADLGYKIKLLGLAQRSADGIGGGSIRPWCRGAAPSPASTACSMPWRWRRTMSTSCCSPVRGGPPTASSVLSDILDIGAAPACRRSGCRAAAHLSPGADAGARGGYYVRLNARDVPGAFANVATRMAEVGISLESVIQRSDLRVNDPAADEVKTRTVVLITHSTMEATVREALARIADDGFIVGKPQLIRIETF